MRRSAALIALGLALTLPAFADAGSEQADQRLEKSLNKLVAMPDGPPGVGVVVQRGGQLRFHTAGRARLDSPKPFRLDDHMRIASVTKAFTGAVTLKLVERGKLSLSDTIGELRPEMPPSWHAITVRQLMYHTSGLPNYTATAAFQTYFVDHLTDYISPAQVIGFAASEPLEFPPGTRYEYSNTGTFVLGLMIETVTGRSYAKNLRDLVLKPLGMNETTLPFTSPALPKPFIRGYVFAGPGQPQENVSQAISPSGVWAAGGIVSTPRDLNRFARAWGGGSLLDKPAVRRAQTALPPSVQRRRAARPRAEPRRADAVSLPHLLRGRVRAQRQLPGIHAVDRGDARRPQLDGRLGQHAACSAEHGSAGRLPLAAPHRPARCVLSARRLLS